MEKKFEYKKLGWWRKGSKDDKSLSDSSWGELVDEGNEKNK